MEETAKHEYECEEFSEDDLTDFDTYERTKEYVKEQFIQNTLPKPQNILPNTTSMPNTVSLDRHDNHVASEMAQILLRKDIIIARLSNLNDKPESFII